MYLFAGLFPHDLTTAFPIKQAELDSFGPPVASTSMLLPRSQVPAATKGAGSGARVPEAASTAAMPKNSFTESRRPVPADALTASPSSRAAASARVMIWANESGVTRFVDDIEVKSSAFDTGRPDF